MFNHARTLLLNQDGSKAPGEDFPGEELVPPNFKAVDTVGYLQTVRSFLFGSDPDRAMLNFRLKQYMALLHSTELEQYVLDLDPRITYDTSSESTLVTDTFYFKPTVRQLTGETASLLLQGSPVAPDASGKCYYNFEVRPVNDTIEVRQRAPKLGSVSTLVAVGSDGFTDAVVLPGTGYRAKINSINGGNKWSITGYLRPQWGLGHIVEMFKQIGETVMLQLFGTGKVEPYYTFNNLWYQHTEMPYQLGAVLIALAYRMEERRRGG